MKNRDEEFLRKLRGIYEGKNKLDEFELEELIYKTLIPLLRTRLGTAGYDLGDPLNIGSTAAICIVEDRSLNQRRALKLPRPRLGRLADIVSIMRAERSRLAALNHHNITKVYYADEVTFKIKRVDYGFPFFIMDYLDEVEDLDKFILIHLNRLDGVQIIEYFHDILTGLAFLHSEGVIHCDLKPGNMLIAKDSPALIADFGYAKHLPRPHDDAKALTEAYYTAVYAHPRLRQEVRDTSDSNANRAVLKREQLEEQFDLYAFGRSMQDILSQIREEEASSDQPRVGGVESRSVFSRYQWLYLETISKRLLDGQVEGRGDTGPSGDLIPGLTDSVMAEICYDTASAALIDVGKLGNLYDLEGEIPELNPNIASYIQIPGAKIPLTARTGAVLHHPLVQRLGQTTQLGFVSLIYPGAVHTRLEHVLGTFASACQYVRALWYDETSCLFRSLMTARDLAALLLATILHDLGQYPMAHDLREVSKRFSHEGYTELLLYALPPDGGPSLAQVIETEWKITPDEIFAILDADEKAPFKARVLHSVISGPLDCDKMDYLMRDSIHMGVSFGHSVDSLRIIRNLTVAYQTKDTRAGLRRLTVAEIGVNEKALSAAHGLWRARRDMFTQVYWQHTARALKAMLGFVGRRVLTGEDRLCDEFWDEFETWVAGDLALPFRARPRSKEHDRDREITQEDVPDFLRVSGHVDQTISSLSLGDDSLLQLFWNHSDESGRRIVDLMRQRRLFARVAVLSSMRSPQLYSWTYDQFRGPLIEDRLDQLEELRGNWEETLIDLLEEELDDTLSLAPQFGSKRSVLESLRAVTPLLLVDVPVKDFGGAGGPDVIWFVPEDIRGVHAQQTVYPSFDFAPVTLAERSFDLEVGKIRVFVHPTWCDLVTTYLDPEAIIERLFS